MAHPKPPTPLSRGESLSAFSSCQMASVRKWEPDQCRNDRLVREAGQAPTPDYYPKAMHRMFIHSHLLILSLLTNPILSHSIRHVSPAVL
ncbi:hypothetical protein AG1IA_06862 [Rhizoctonia solani AG-1 IA]|uniref:Uncharacterized protein n=1 Tax=Thanatephorus cucumeris (strain AG1-IA) TaxID=983506 RepID=L8WQR8_THACA|nr:hypothetical protein AG1IA_06862 [Rhizoctonia solani AG-1 IA]